MKNIIIIACSLLLCSQTLRAQHGHDHSRNEIGISTGALYGIDDKEWGLGIHAHYFRTLGDHSRWALGGYAEQAWLGGGHFSIGAGARFTVIDRLQIAAMPGVTFARHNEEHEGHDDHGHDHDSNGNAMFSMHGELVYDLFEWDRFHMGPVVDYSWSQGDSHIMVGLHGAFCF